MAKVYLAIDGLLNASKENREYMEDLMSKLMAVSDVLALEDEGVCVEKTQGRSRVKWDHNAAKAAVTKQIIDQYIDGDGRLTVPIEKVVEDAFSCTGLTWKVTRLRELKVNPDQYSEKKDGKISFRISAAAPPVENKPEQEDDDDFI